MFGPLFRTAAVLAVLIALGCEVTDSLSTDPDFGDAYSIILEDPTRAPRLDAEGLHLTVQYSGGCNTHVFDVRFRTVGETTEIWLRHDANGDACEAFLTEPLRRAVSSRALETAGVVLLIPDGSTFTLR